SHLGQRQPRFDTPHRLISPQPLLGNIGILLTYVPRPELIDPYRLHDAEHPAVETRTLLKLVLAGERPLASRLHQIVGIARAARKPARKPPQSGQNRKQLVAELGRHSVTPRPAS